MPNHIVTTTAHVGGTVSPSGLVSVADGADQAFVATPAANHLTHLWLKDGVPIAADTDNWTLVNVIADHTVDVIFSNLSHALLGDADAVAPMTKTLEGDAAAFPWSLVNLHGDAVAAWEFTIDLNGDAAAILATEILPNDVPNPQRVCDSALKQCLPCNEDPISNYSSEDADPALFCAVATYAQAVPPLGQCGGLGGRDLSCTLPCCSPISDEDAYLCALARAQICVLGGTQ